MPVGVSKCCEGIVHKNPGFQLATLKGLSAFHCIH